MRASTLIASLLLVATLLPSMLTGQTLSEERFRFARVSKDSKREAKRYERDGYLPFPGNPPIEHQLNGAFSKLAEVDDEGFPQWIIANGSSVAQTQAAAEMQATELAKNNLVGLIETNMRSVVESDVSNNQLDATQAATITKTIQVSANRVAKKLGRVQPLFKVYRAVGNNTEVQIMLAYNYEMVRRMIIEEMQAELQLESDDVRERHQEFLNPDTYNRGTIENYSDR